jgi:hypothetical protein
MGDGGEKVKVIFGVWPLHVAVEIDIEIEAPFITELIKKLPPWRVTEIAGQKNDRADISEPSKSRRLRHPRSISDPTEQDDIRALLLGDVEHRSVGRDGE